MPCVISESLRSSLDPSKNHRSSAAHARHASFFVVIAGKFLVRSNLNCLPNTERVPIPVLSKRSSPFAKISSSKS